MGVKSFNLFSQTKRTLRRFKKYSKFEFEVKLGSFLKLKFCEFLGQNKNYITVIVKPCW